MPVVDAGGIGEMSDSCRGGREEVKSVDKIIGIRPGMLTYWQLGRASRGE